MVEVSLSKVVRRALTSSPLVCLLPSLFSPSLSSRFIFPCLFLFVHCFNSLTEYMIDACHKDYTHIAHELGHVLGLPHPTGGISSSNTLMCPSGCCNDNPQLNSYVRISSSPFVPSPFFFNRFVQENAIHLNQPLPAWFISSTSQPANYCQYSLDCKACYATVSPSSFLLYPSSLSLIFFTVKQRLKTPQAS